MSRNYVENQLTDKLVKELYARFILNLPESYKKNLVNNFYRIFFELQNAYWFYLDFFIETDSTAIDFLGFCQKFFQVYPNIIPKKQDWFSSYQYWRNYKTHTPTGSAILLNEAFNKVLLVRGFNSNKWCFPGGKLDEDESFVDCAIREVREEIDYEIENKIVDWLHFDFTRENTLHRAFIIENVSEKEIFKPTTRFEIEAISWFNLEDLPERGLENRVKEHFGINKDSFLLLLPYTSSLKEYARNRKSYDISMSFKLITQKNLQKRHINIPMPNRGSEVDKSQHLNVCSNLPRQSKFPNLKILKFKPTLTPDDPLSYLENMEFDYDKINKMFNIR